MKKMNLDKFPKWIQELIKPDVIKCMQIKFVAVAMGILILVFLLMLGSINMIMKTVSQSQSMQLLEQLAQSERYDKVTADIFGDRPAEDIPPPDREPPTEEMTDTIPSAEIMQEGVIALSWGNRENDPRFHDDWKHDDDDDPQKKEWEENWKKYWEEYEKQYEKNPDLPPPPDDWDDWDDWKDDWQEWDNYYPLETDMNIPPETVPSDPPQTDPPPPPESDPPPPEIPAAVDPVPPPQESEPQSPPPDDPEPVRESNPPPPPPETIPTESDPPVTEVLTTTQTEPVSPTETEMLNETEEETQTSASETLPPQTTVETWETPPPIPRDDPNRDFRMDMRPDKWKLNIMLDHFALMADSKGNFLGIRNTENYTDEQAEEILSGILNAGKQKGMYGWLQYYKTEKEYGTLIVLTDKSSDQGLLNNLFRTTVIIGLLMLLILFVFLIFSSRWITNPVRIALERQKQFVSDAGHELKTPLAVLTANADILQDEIGENKWLGYMREQTDRMSQLVGDLLRLARMDNAAQNYTMEDFNLSTAIEATALPFESQAFELQKNLEIDIQPDINYYGSQQHIRQLAAIFIDNAMKYSDIHGTIKITLLQRGDHKILEFYNTGCEISQKETEKIFERFYRGDKARKNTGKNGYGLGLAIAKSIMEMHKIKIQVTCEQDSWIRFLMIM